MPALGHTGHWKKVDQDDSLLFARGQAVVLPSGRKATLTMYWVSADHEYCGCASIKYCDNNDTAVISVSLLRSWQPGKNYAPPPLRQFSQSLPVSPSEVSTPTNAPKQRRKKTMKPTPTAPATRVAHINDVPAVVTARDFYNDVTTQLENASELLGALQSSYTSAAKPTPDKLADELLKRAEALLAGEAVPKSDQERLNLLALKVDTLSKAKPEAFKKYERARSLASANYCAGEIPDMLEKKRQQLDLLQRLHTLSHYQRKRFSN